MKYALILVFGMVALSGCGDSKASVTQAIEISGPAGVRCFAIQEDGRSVGGNCIAD